MKFADFPRSCFENHVSSCQVIAQQAILLLHVCTNMIEIGQLWIYCCNILFNLGNLEIWREGCSVFACGTCGGQPSRQAIHDATHSTLVNNRIRCRDKVRSPSARDKQYLMACFQEKGATVFSLVGDISKAHRRFVHAPEERGLMACRFSPG